MIRKLEFEGVTVFPQREIFRFVDGINIIVGGNDSGKSHLMKLCYAIAKWSASASQRHDLPEAWAEERRLRQCVLRAFGAHDLSGLTARNRGKAKARIKASLYGEKVPVGTAELAFQFNDGQEEAGLHISTLPDRYLSENAVFIVPREVLSIYPCYMQVGKRYPELLDGPSWEMCCALEEEPTAPLERDSPLREVLRHIESLLHGRLRRINGRFYLQRPGQDPMELNLVAEGFKRLGTLGLLISNGTVKKGTTLFWDEPEMNINAGYLPMLVRIMMALCRAGVQVILSTHSLFMLRELVIQLGDEDNKDAIARRFIGLQPSKSEHGGVRSSSGRALEELDHIESLDAEMEQADRYLSLGRSPQRMIDAD